MQKATFNTWFFCIIKTTLQKILKMILRVVTIIEHRKKFLINILYFFTLLLIFYFIIRFCFNYIMPLIIGIIPAFLVQKPALYFAKKINLKQETVSVILVFVFYLVLLAVLYTVFFLLYNNFGAIENKFLNYTKSFLHLINKFENYFNKFDFSLNSVLEPFVSKITTYLSGVLGNALTKLPTMLINIIVMLVTSVYISKDFKKIKTFLLESLPKNYIQTLGLIKKIAVSDCIKMLKGYTLMALIAFVIMFVYFFVFRFNNAFVKAAVIALIDALPVFGVGTILIPYSVICFINKNVQKGILLIFLYFLITVARNSLQPKIMGKQTGIHPLITLISLLLGLKFFGAKGLLLMPYIVVVAIHYLKEKFIINHGLA